MAKYSKKSEYLNQYKLDDSGKYIYQGKYLSLNASPSEIKSVYLKFWIFSALISAAVIASGCINAAGMSNTFYVILPYIAEVAMLFLYLLNGIKLFSQGYKVKEYQYKTCFPRLSPFSMGIAIAAAIGFICSVIFIILNGFEGQTVKCIIYLVFKLIVFCSAFYNSRFIGSLKWMEI